MCSQKCKINPRLIFISFASLFTGAELSHFLSFPGHAYATIWLSSGLFVGLLLTAPYKAWPSYILGAFLANTTSDCLFHTLPLPTSLGYFFANVLEACAAAWAFKKIIERSGEYSFGFSVAASILTIAICSAVAALIGTATEYLQFGSNFYETFRLWWISDLIGLHIVLPLFIAQAVSKKNNYVSFHPWTPGRYLEIGIVSSLTLILTLNIFLWPTPKSLFSTESPSLVFPLIVWCALRFSRLMTALHVLFIVLIANYATIHQLGPFALTDRSIEYQTGLIQIFAFLGTLIGNVIGYALETRDKAEQKLTQSDKLIRGMLEGSSDLVYVLDKQRRFILASKTLSEILGLPIEKIRGLPFNDFFHKKDLKSLETSNQDLVKTFSTRNAKNSIYETTLTTKFREISILASETLVYDLNEEIESFIGVGIDISDRKKIEEELRGARLKAEDASRSKSEFLTFVSHEIRTPMNAILGMVALTLGTELTEKQKDYLYIVKQSSELLISLLDEILDLSKIEAGKLHDKIESFSLRKLMDDITSLFIGKSIQKGINFSATIVYDVTDTVRTDLTKVRHILHNLIGNSIKFTEEGEINFRISNLKKETGVEGLRVNVSDTGKGIPQDIIDKVFEPFCQGNPEIAKKSSGSGLGLSICSKLVKYLGGNIVINPTRKIGTEFVVDLPCAFESSESIASQKNNSENVPCHLFLEDANIADSIENYLKFKNIPIHFTARKATEMRKLLRSHEVLNATTPQIIFIDHTIDSKAIESTLKKNDQIQFIVIQNDLFSNENTKLVYLYPKSISQINAPILFHPLNELIDRIVYQSCFSSMPVIGKKNKFDSPSSRKTKKPPTFRVLAVDDNQFNLIVLKEMLTLVAVETITVQSGPDALARLKHENFDLVFMDVLMPEMDGFQTTEEIRKSKISRIKNIPIVALTAYTSQDVFDQCIAAGMNSWLTKPITLDKLKRIVDDYKSKIYPIPVVSKVVNTSSFAVNEFKNV